MVRRSIVPILAVSLLATPLLAGGNDWVAFENESGDRIQAASGLVASDPREKDYAWDDLDMDGDIDMVIVRKLPFTTPTGFRNVLLMNEGVADGQAMDGVLVDRTDLYAVQSDDGSQGFLDPTNDRDVEIVDVNGDGWPDIVTATAYGQGDSKSMSHPRIYINLGEIDGEWQGFEYQANRIPQLQEAPNTCGLSSGDITGDGAPELYFVTYNSSFEDFLLINDGNGFFTDESDARLTSAMRSSSFGTAAEIEDMNLDGWKDIVKSENGPVEVLYNSGNGFFTQAEDVAGGANYHQSVGDLNNDGLLDIICSNDGIDHFLLNQGNGQDGLVDFQSKSFQWSSGGDDGFGSDSLTVDIDNDGFNDVLIADVDVDIGGCSRRLHIFHNQGDVPNVSLIEQGTGGIPTNMLAGTHDVACFDINGDGWKDLIIGRCNSTEVWMQDPPISVIFNYPNGRPDQVEPNVVTPVMIEIAGAGGGELDPSSPTLHASVDREAFVESPLVHIGGDMYRADLPAADCPSSIQWYISADLNGGETWRNPVNAPASFYTAQAITDVEVTVDEAFEGDVSDWSVVNENLTSGAWEQADPIGTIHGVSVAAPDQDHTEAGSLCFVTQNGLPGGTAFAADVDGGPTRLVSPAFDLEGTDGTIEYARWFYASGAEDVFTVEISNDDGKNWVFVENVATTGSEWAQASLLVSDHVTPTADVRVRFSIEDVNPGTVVEGGIDDLSIVAVVCEEPCLGDIDDSGSVGTPDLLSLLAAWGGCGSCPEDLDDNGSVDVADLLILLAAWGDC